METLDYFVTPEIYWQLGFIKDGFNAWNKCVSPWPETRFKQLSFSGDYLYLREGNLDEPRSKDDIVTLWNNDLRGAIPLSLLQQLYYILTGSLLQSPFDLPS